MTPAADDVLHVLQMEWRKGLRQILHGAGPREQVDGVVYLGHNVVGLFAGNSGIEIPALGSAHVWLHVNGRVLEWLSRIRQDTEILPLRYSDGRLRFHRMSITCTDISAQFDTTDPEEALALAAETARRGTQRLQIRAAAERAASHLGWLSVTTEDLEALCMETVQRTPIFPNTRPQTLAALAVAWQMLAQFSVQPGDILNMAHRKIRSAWVEDPVERSGTA